MSLTDEEFREEYHPLQVPGHFYKDDTQENKIVYALAQIGEGTAAQVADELAKLEAQPANEQLQAMIKTVLKSLYKKGLLKGSEQSGEMHYNLSKIEHANDGDVNPDLPAPGLD